MGCGIILPNQYKPERGGGREEGREVEQFVIVNKYIQISGNVMVTYNLGQQDIVIRDTSSKVNDGKYHVVRFSRTGVNSTLQVDDNQVNLI